MDTFHNGNGSVWYSKLESEVLLTDLYDKLSFFHINERAKVVTSWLANSFSDLTNPSSELDTGINCFVVHIKLVNSLVTNSSFANELSELFSNDFLHAFVKPSLLNTSQNGEALADATNYFQLVCENLSQPLLIGKVVEFANSSLLPVLLVRLKSKDSDILGATLGLFRALLEFYCENIWHELILQHLLPMKHLLVEERLKSITEINFQEATSKFIDLVPSSIYSSVPPETLADHFVHYVEQELQRIRNTKIITSSRSLIARSETAGIPVINVEPEIANITYRNPIFPLWVFKYDGTDVTHAARKYKLSEPEEYFEDDLFQFFNDEQIPNAVSLDEIEDDVEQNFQQDPEASSSIPTFQLPQGPDSIRFYAQPVMKTGMQIRPSSVSDVLSLPTTTGISPPSWKVVGEDQGYFGPFLESLFQIMDKWTWLDNQVMVPLSDLLSVLASSRIPLITSILLDFSVVLQPCFPNFHGILHSIKTRLDGSLKKYPESFIQQEWKRATLSANNITLTKSMSEEDLFEEPTNFADTLRIKFLQSSPFAFVNKSTSSKLAKLFGPKSKDKRILTSSPSAIQFRNEEEEIIARKTILRSIMFTHWMLELGAISQQSCWFQSPQTQRQEEDDYF